MERLLTALTASRARVALGLILVATATSMLLAAPASAQEVPGRFTGDMPAEGGVALLTWSGGSIQQMSAAAPRATSFWITVDGVFVGLIAGAPDFVNSDFVAEHPQTYVPPGVILLVLEPAGPYVPLAADVCGAIFDAIEAELPGGKAARAEVAFEHELLGASGTGCRLSVTGTGDALGSYVAVANAIREVLAAAGWVEDPAFAADGPTATHSVFRAGTAIAIIEASVVAPGIECPQDAPISVCFEDLMPAQFFIEASVVLARP